MNDTTTPEPEPEIPPVGGSDEPEPAEPDEPAEPEPDEPEEPGAAPADLEQPLGDPAGRLEGEQDDEP